MNDFNHLTFLYNMRIRGNELVKCNHLHYKEGYKMVWHSHDFPQLWYCAEGKYLHDVNGVEYECKAGDLLIVPPRFGHSFVVHSQSDVELYMLNLSHRFLSELVAKDAMRCAELLYFPGFDDIKESHAVFVFSFKEGKRDFAKAFFDKLLQCDILPEAAVVKLICEFFGAEEFGSGKAVSDKVRKQIEGKLLPIVQAIEHITNHYTEKLAVEDIAHSVAMSRTMFLTCFKKYTGVSFSNYILLLRIDLCEALLGCTDLSVAVVSDLCGFSNHSHMIKAYKKYKGNDFAIRFAEVRANHREYFDKHPEVRELVRKSLF